MQFVQQMHESAKHSSGSAESADSGEMRLSAYYFYLGAAVNLLAWSPVLCRVTRGVVRYPDRMPTAVWIAPYGIAAVFDLFVIAQASRMTNWVRELPAVPPGVRYLRFFSLGKWRDIVTFGACMAFVLVSGVLYGVPSIRSWFGIHPQKPAAEPWCIMFFMLLSYLVFRAISFVAQKMSYRVHHQGVALLLYLMLGLAIFFGWGRVVMTNVHTHNEAVWGIALLCLFFLVLFVHVCFVTCDTEYQAVPQEDEAQQDENKALHSLHEAHSWAVVFHVGLIVWTLLIGISVSGDYTDDYILSHLSTYFLTTDWEYVSLTKEQTSGKFDVPYCATENAMPVFYLLCCCAWSAASATQHALSCAVLSKPTSVAECSPAPLIVSIVDKLPGIGWIVGWGAVFAGLMLPVVHNYGLSTNLLVATVVIPAVAAHVWRWRAVVNTQCYVVLCIAAVAALVWYLYVAAPKQLVATGLIAAVAALVWYLCAVAPKQLYPAEQPLSKTRRYKWTEYSFSATLMFLVVQLNSRVMSAHELVLGTGCFGLSMLLVHSVDAHLDRVEPLLGLRQQANDELAFVYLSFFAKGILCVALTVPVLFIPNINYETKPVPCTPAQG